MNNELMEWLGRPAHYSIGRPQAANGDRPLVGSPRWSRFRPLANELLSIGRHLHLERLNFKRKFEIWKKLLPLRPSSTL